LTLKIGDNVRAIAMERRNWHQISSKIYQESPCGEIISKDKNIFLIKLLNESFIGSKSQVVSFHKIWLNKVINCPKYLNA